MNYLHCHACGCQNPATEFLTFCNNCHKKLQNNYADWKGKHPGQPYEQFLAAIATASRTPPGTPGTGWIKRTTHHRRRYMLTCCIIILLSIITGTIIGKRLVITWFYPGVNKAWLYTSWERMTIGRQALQISTPAHLRINDKALPPDLASGITYHKRYTNDQDEGMKIEVKFFSYLINTSNSLHSAAIQSVKSMETSPDISDIQYKELPAQPSDKTECLLQQGTYRYKEAILLSFSNLVMVRGQHRWIVSLHYRADDQTGREIADRILRTVNIKDTYGG
ncbi:hypothetical protein KTO58_18520 [Chitinophaga pendula]|uniref:hypothetical protein n=1 Tax=Chitinophaga TaxID=79328 RepID=UPI000BAED165|nr:MULTISPECIES: hypothetical protein [Chitinophaga]ASZ11326.1 hypothetical protein CK934_10290 [Chitinophaga sp. MD30]UCJ05671.1 hypothetical protein KTO58_18520 [Chitinophaga pendula]